MLPKEEKVEAVRRLEEDIRSSSGLLLTDYRGLNVSDITDLRRKLREAGAEYKVVKNTLFKRAVAQAQTSGINLDELLEGPTAVAFVHNDPITVAKVLTDFMKEHKTLAIKGGYIEGQVYGAAQIEQLSKIPAKPVLYAQLLGSMQSPIVNLVGTLQGVISNLVYTLQAVADKKAA
ncbi:MAG: 50S ribosomal protein L10 [Armatimonadetes bacterium]|nr:50S ribosomal protein L10 [Armatimonadota bacterium]